MKISLLINPKYLYSCGNKYRILSTGRCNESKSICRKNEKGLLEPYEYELGEIGPDDIDIEIENCGLCYSDVHYIDNDFSNNEYPFVPGHEVIGRLRQLAVK